MISRRMFLKAASLSLAAGAVIGCAPALKPDQADPVVQESAEAPAQAGEVISVVGPEGEVTERDLQGFTEKYPGRMVERLDADAAQLAEMLAGGNPPNVIRTDGATLPSLLLQGVPLDITSYLVTSSILKEDDFAPACEYYHLDGKWYGLPKDWSPDFSFYMNTALAEEAGVELPPVDRSITYSDLFDLGRRLVKKDGERTLVAGYAYEPSFFARQLMAILREADQALYAEDFGRVILQDNPLALEVLEGFVQIAREGITWSPLNPCPSWPGQEFLSGTEGIAGYGYWFHAMINNPAPEAKVNGKNAAFFPAPTWMGNRTVNPTIGGTGYIGVKAAQSPASAWAFLEWYLGDRPAQERAASGWGVPALKSLYAQMPRGNDFQRQVQGVLQYTFDHGDADFALKFNPYYSDQVFNDSFTRALDGVLKGNMSVVGMAAEIEKEVNVAIDQGRKGSG